jgi:hypothetical protein
VRSSFFGRYSVFPRGPFHRPGPLSGQSLKALGWIASLLGQGRPSALQVSLERLHGDSSLPWPFSSNSTVLTCPLTSSIIWMGAHVKHLLGLQEEESMVSLALFIASAVTAYLVIRFRVRVVILAHAPSKKDRLHVSARSKGLRNCRRDPNPYRGNRYNPHITGMQPQNSKGHCGALLRKQCSRFHNKTQNSDTGSRRRHSKHGLAVRRFGCATTV